MRLLLANDDGVYSPGLAALADVLAGELVADREPLRLSQLPALLPPEDLSTMMRLLEQDIVRDFGLLR